MWRSCFVIIVSGGGWPEEDCLLCLIHLKRDTQTDGVANSDMMYASYQFGDIWMNYIIFFITS